MRGNQSVPVADSLLGATYLKRLPSVDSPADQRFLMPCRYMGPLVLMFAFARPFLKTIPQVTVGCGSLLVLC